MSEDARRRGSDRHLQFRGAMAMWVVAAGLATIYVLSNLPTPLYETYRQAFGFSKITLTLIYAVYVVGTVTTMFFLGRLSDEIGRRPVVLPSLGLAAMVSQSLHDPNRALAGGVVAEVFLVGALTIATWPRVDPRTGMLIGLVLLIPGVVLLVAAEAAHSRLLLWVSTTIAGVASGLGYRFGLQRVNELSPEDRRSEVISSYLMVCYAAISLPVIGAGVLASATDPLLADTIFGGLTVLLALAALAGEARRPRRAEPRRA